MFYFLQDDDYRTSCITIMGMYGVCVYIYKIIYTVICIIMGIKSDVMQNRNVLRMYNAISIQ